MNYKFPLVNLITRGHVRVDNPTSCVNFINSLDNHTAQKLYEQLMYIENISMCGQFLNHVQENIELATGVRSCLSERSFMEQRDLVLMKESAEETITDAAATSEAKKLIKMIKVGIPIAVALKVLAKYDEESATKIKQKIKLMDSDVSNFLNKSWITRPVVKAKNFSIRFTKAALTGKKKHLKHKDIKFLKGMRTAALVATGLAAALLAISYLYKKVFSAEARACKKYSGKERTVCMTRARIAACDSAIKKSEDALSKCDSSSNPEDCRFKMRVEVRTWSKKKRIEEERLAKLLRVSSSAFTEKKPSKNDPFA